MGKITERVSHPDDPIFKEGLRMYSVRLGPEVAQKSKVTDCYFETARSGRVPRGGSENSPGAAPVPQVT
jgi:hypothetical protein